MEILTLLRTVFLYPSTWKVIHKRTVTVEFLNMILECNTFKLAQWENGLRGALFKTYRYSGAHDNVKTQDLAVHMSQQEEYIYLQASWLK